MGICPLSNEPCSNLKNECIYENINGEKTELNLCNRCAPDYIHSVYFKKDYLEVFEKNKQLQQENNEQQLKIREIKFINEDKFNLYKFMKSKLSGIKNFFKHKFKRKKEEISEVFVESKMNPEKMRNLYYKVKEDQKIDFENNNIQEADKKQTILSQIKSDVKIIRKMQKVLIEATLVNDKELVDVIEKDIDDLLSKYAELYKELFG